MSEYGPPCSAVVTHALSAADAPSDVPAEPSDEHAEMLETTTTAGISG